MIAKQKIITSCLLVALLCTEYVPAALAEGGAVHSLDELPSIQTEESISNLIQEKKAFETTTAPTTQSISQEEPMHLSASTLVEEREMYIAADVS